MGAGFRRGGKCLRWAVSPLEWAATGPDGVMGDFKYREVLKRGGLGWKRSSAGFSQEMRKGSK